MNRDQHMRGFLEVLARALAPDAPSIEVRLVDGRRATAFEIHLGAPYRGAIIGKGGTVIHALRNLVQLSARRHRRRWEVEVPHDHDGPQ